MEQAIILKDVGSRVDESNMDIFTYASVSWIFVAVKIHLDWKGNENGFSQVARWYLTPEL